MIIKTHVDTAHVSLLQSLGEDNSFHVPFGDNILLSVYITSVVQNSFLGHCLTEITGETGIYCDQLVGDRVSLLMTAAFSLLHGLTFRRTLEKRITLALRLCRLLRNVPFA